MANDNRQEESWWILPIAMIVLAVALTFVIWMIYTRAIVRHGVVIFHYADVVWNWLPIELVQRYDASLESRYAWYWAQGEHTRFLDWIKLVSDFFRPFSLLLVVLTITLIVQTWLGPRLDLRRRFKGDDLIIEIMKRFSGVAPVAKLNLINSTNPLWRPQMWPDELVREYVLARDQRVVPERARRFYVQTLGPRLVDLRGADATNPEKICFADRMTPTGKAIYAILCAFAFGGQEGRQQAWKTMDLLNYSAYGTPNGEANLTLAETLFQQYRMQKEAHSLFRVHHYENTYLYELFRRAKRWGRINTPHFRWLRPMDRYKYLGLNTLMRFTPHPEAAAIFNLHAFERACFKQGRIPLSPGAAQPPGPNDPKEGSSAGSNAPSRYPEPGLPYVEDAVESLELDYETWLGRRDADSEDDIWKDKGLWTMPNRAYNTQAAATPPVPPGPDTPFDEAMKAEDDQAEARRQEKLHQEEDFLNNLGKS
jgi:hypothetical protein